MSDDAKKLILARRARFVAAAVASVGIACGKTTEKEAPPVPCLSVALSYDAGAPPPPEAGTEEAGVDAARFVPCLSQIAPARDAGPMPCLKVAEPKKDGGR